MRKGIMKALILALRREFRELMNIPCIRVRADPERVKYRRYCAHHSEGDEDEIDGLIDQHIDVTAFGRSGTRVLNELAVLT
jgi:hypothetical protein